MHPPPPAQAGAVGSAVEVLAQTLKLEGVGGLYAGYSAALLRNLPSNMLNFTAFVPPSTLHPHLHRTLCHACHAFNTLYVNKGRGYRGSPIGAI